MSTSCSWKSSFSAFPLGIALSLSCLLFFLSCGGGSISVTQHEHKRCVGKAPQKGDMVRAVVNNQLECLKDLLQAGADINENVGDEDNMIDPLLAAVALQRDQIANFLMERGAATHRMFHGYRAKDFSLYLYGDGAPLTRTLGRLQKPN